MAEDSDQEKTLAAAPRRLEQAREEGQVARSRELSAFAVMAASAGLLWGAGSLAVDFCTRMMRVGLSLAGSSDQRAKVPPGFSWLRTEAKPSGE